MEETQRCTIAVTRSTDIIHAVQPIYCIYAAVAASVEKDILWYKLQKIFWIQYKYDNSWYTKVNLHQDTKGDDETAQYALQCAVCDKCWEEIKHDVWRTAADTAQDGELF